MKWTLWDSNPGPSGYLPNLLTHLWLRMPYGIEPYAYHITKERTSRQKLPTGLKKGVKWTLWGSNPGPSGYLPNLLTHLWLRMPYGIEPYAYHITKERTSRQKLPTGF
ncbi:MAG: hypothetical protein ACLSG4_01160 [Anaerobutyricum sp.]